MSQKKKSALCLQQAESCEAIASLVSYMPDRQRNLDKAAYWRREAEVALSLEEASAAANPTIRTSTNLSHD